MKTFRKRFGFLQTKSINFKLFFFSLYTADSKKLEAFSVEDFEELHDGFAFLFAGKIAFQKFFGFRRFSFKRL